MQKLLLFSLLIGLSAKNYAQSKSDKSLPKKDATELLNDGEDSTYKPNKPNSYFTAGIAMGNRLLSVNNKVANSKQTSQNALIYTPSIAYQNKSGFNIAAGTSLLNDSSKGFTVNQYYLTTGYQLQGNSNIDFSIAYTHYFIADKYSISSSPIQNDLFTSLVYKKTWLQPGVAFDFSSGNSYEDNKRGRYYDSITNKLKSYAFIASVSHEFSWESVLKDDDGLTFSPSFLLNLGTSKVTILHKTNATSVAQLVGKKGKLTKFQNTKFGAESVGIDIDASYTIGKFTLEPDLYLDYYLPETTTNRVTNVFNINLSYRF
ncbi:MAG: hypothetical protein H7334_02005 [Ferruginibacter sp.]|nr:hypothetical protein [Ferruginibacter sp.]